MRISIVGAGVSGIHAALTLLESGFAVDLWDLGGDEAPFPLPGRTFHQLKTELPDATTWFLGPNFEALVPPGGGELLHYPPARTFFAHGGEAPHRFDSDGFFPFASYATGGLAKGWGTNAVPYDADDLRDWPIDIEDLAAAYGKVGTRMPLAAPVADDLSPYLGAVPPNQPAMPLTALDQRLLRAYRRRAGRFGRRGILLGHARLAVTTAAHEQHACDLCDRCLWGCPRKATYDPSRETLAACRRFEGFRYRDGRAVMSVRAVDGRAVALRYQCTRSGEMLEEPVDLVLLAAGALQTGGILLRSLPDAAPSLDRRTLGLMDTTVVKVPYIVPGAIGSPVDERVFQFNRLLVGLVAPRPGWPRYLHGEVLNLSGLLYHGLMSGLPGDARLALRVFMTLRSALGVVTLFFPDRRFDSNHIELQADGSSWGRLRLRYADGTEKTAMIGDGIRRLRSALWGLGCVPYAPSVTRGGGGIHYAGTVPMGDGPLACDATGRSRLLANLYIADGAAFPTLPSKSITLNLAAHATRVALSVARSCGTPAVLHSE